MNEQQHLEEVIKRFLQSTQENEEIAKEDAAYLKRRIRPAMEYLIGQENIDGMKKLEDRGWFGEQELNGFLTKSRRTGKMGCFPGIAGLEEPYFRKRKIHSHRDETGTDRRSDETLQK